ncbi:Gfo/Idh/MocA family oxidoreductase [Brevibacterium sp. XM4083]|uniref:Gfo/Idh/MocA family protein n=1 Tax=Brevibacterium sp. XM4083 TaxID=2583238 RepID=UPI00112ACFCC|nr:Gfo/Idh/MocA family oxidoreductase [Brevibacterium sp. XM4083]MCM1012843.1 Gfo/Idh/MocA family oxidoreductase [Brevibacterium sp. XM4083]
MTVLRAGLVGLGMMGRHHLRNLRALEGTVVVGVADPLGDPQGIASGLAVYTDVDSLLEQNLDYCVVAVPTDHHLTVGTKLAAAGVHALIEKPVAADSQSAETLVRAFADRSLIGAVGHIERFNPALLALKQRLDANELGDIYQVATRRQGPFPARIADVGVTKDLASHDIDLTSWLTGKNYVRVAANTALKSGRAHEDMVASTCMLSNGVMTSHVVNWLTPFKERSIAVTGENGTFVADTLTADLIYYENASALTEWDDISHFRGVAEGNVTRYALTKSEPLRTEHQQFQNAVNGDREATIVTLEQGKRVVAVCEAMLESSLTGSSVELSINYDEVNRT